MPFKLKIASFIHCFKVSALKKEEGAAEVTWLNPSEVTMTSVLSQNSNNFYAFILMSYGELCTSCDQIVCSI